MKTATTHRFLADPESSGTGRETQPSFGDDVENYSFLIADDHPPMTMAVSVMLAQVIGTTPVTLKSFTRSDELLAACASPSSVPRIVVLDLVMPGDLKRVALVRAIHDVARDVRILVYTAEESAFLASAVMEAGAMGFVTKTSPATELMAALAAVIKGQKHIDQRIDAEEIKSHPWFTLTESERAVLLAFCRGSKAADIVSATGRSYSTVTTHKYNGLSKLGLKDGSDLLGYIYLNGLVHELD